MRRFDPRSVGAPRCYLRADCGLSLSGSAVISWTDLSSNAYVLTDGGVEAKRPTLVADGINGHPVVRFDGSANRLRRSTSWAGMSACSMFAVLKQSGGTGYRAILTGNSASYYAHVSGSDWGMYLGAISTTASDIGTTAFRCLISVAHAADNWDAYTDDTSEIGIATGLSFTDTRGAISLGADDTFDLHYFGGDIAEIGVWPFAFSASHVEWLQEYARAAYALDF